MILCINPDSMRIHSNDFNLTAKFGNYSLDVFAAGNERVELHLSVTNVALQNLQLLTQIDTLLDRRG